MQKRKLPTFLKIKAPIFELFKPSNFPKSMRLPDNIFFEVPSLPGAGFIVNTVNSTYPVGKVYKFKTMGEIDRFCESNLIDKKTKGLMRVPGYSIIIAPVGNLEDIELPYKSGMDLNTLASMVNFYEKEYISNKRPAFKRYQTN